MPHDDFDDDERTFDFLVWGLLVAWVLFLVGCAAYSGNVSFAW